MSATYRAPACEVVSAYLAEVCDDSREVCQTCELELHSSGVGRQPSLFREQVPGSVPRGTKTLLVEVDRMAVGAHGKASVSVPPPKAVSKDGRSPDVSTRQPVQATAIRFN